MVSLTLRSVTQGAASTTICYNVFDGETLLEICTVILPEAMTLKKVEKWLKQTRKKEYEGKDKSADVDEEVLLEEALEVS
jgi:hypothetical protein